MSSSTARRIGRLTGVWGKRQAAVVRARAPQQRRRGERGAELVEFALVLPLLLMIFGGIVDFGMLLQRQQVLTNAAREGARLAVLPGYETNDYETPKARVTDFVRVGLNDLSAAPVTAVTVVTLSPGTGPAFPAAQVTVTLNDSFLILGPLVSLAGGTGSFGTITLTATTTMRVEGAAGS